MTITKSIVEVLSPEDRTGEVCNESRCPDGPVAIIGESGEVSVCATHAALVIKGLLADLEVRRALAIALGGTIIYLTT